MTSADRTGGTLGVDKALGPFGNRRHHLRVGTTPSHRYVSIEFSVDAATYPCAAVSPWLQLMYDS